VSQTNDEELQQQINPTAMTQRETSVLSKWAKVAPSGFSRDSDGSSDSEEDDTHSIPELPDRKRLRLAPVSDLIA
jgi:hypothetical protein